MWYGLSDKVHKNGMLAQHKFGIQKYHRVDTWLCSESSTFLCSSFRVGSVSAPIAVRAWSLGVARALPPHPRIT